MLLLKVAVLGIYNYFFFSFFFFKNPFNLFRIVLKLNVHLPVIFLRELGYFKSY